MNFAMVSNLSLISLLRNPLVQNILKLSSTRNLSTSIRPNLVQSRIINPLLNQQEKVDIKHYESVDANELVAGDLKTMSEEIHQQLGTEIKTEYLTGSPIMREMAKYYFDGQGKAIRPVIAITLGHAFNIHLGTQSDNEVISNQRKVAIISEMIHTASLVHDDILDHAETRRGKISINRKWSLQKGTMCGNYILAIAAKILAQMKKEEILIVLAQVLADLVTGEFQQLQKNADETERFQLYLNKTFHKTASLIAYSCKANAILSGADSDMVESAFQYGRNIGIAFQLVDDLLDFESSSAMLGKPAAADLKLGLATAPVLFATTEYPELEDMIMRRFSVAGDVEKAFEFVRKSAGLERTRELAKNHCNAAAQSVNFLKDSSYKSALMTLTDQSIKRKK